MTGFEKSWSIYKGKFWLENSLSHRKEGDRLGAVQTTETGCGGCEGDRARVGVRSNYCVLGGCLLSLSLCRSGFQDLLRVRPSSLFMLCGCISISVASLMSLSMYPVLAERSFCVL